MCTIILRETTKNTKTVKILSIVIEKIIKLKLKSLITEEMLIVYGVKTST